MEFDLQDQDIINLLTKLKDAASEYPEHMLAARRQSFLKQMTAVGLGIGAVAGIKNALEKTPRTHPFTVTLVEAILIAAILIEISAMAYIYRAKLADFFQTITASSTVEEVTPPPVLPTALEVQGISPAPAVTSILASTTPGTEPASVVVTSTGTAVPGTILEANQISATPDPKGNNGNHYGQTPKPERTKENKPPKNDKPPKEKENKPPKEETKPPKDKRDS
ncbi:MAG TPA: hypothetical protein VFQ13_07590 [Anaerolineales bacterium]|nr:hypothetical protein [Anaerolineales bacterium]